MKQTKEKIVMVTCYDATMAKILSKFNPIAFIMEQCRSVMIYDKMPNFTWLAIWFVVGCLLSWIGVVVIHKYENSYAKVI